MWSSSFYLKDKNHWWVLSGKMVMIRQDLTPFFNSPFHWKCSSQGHPCDSHFAKSTGHFSSFFFSVLNNFLFFYPFFSVLLLLLFFFTRLLISIWLFIILSSPGSCVTFPCFSPPQRPLCLVPPPLLHRGYLECLGGLLFPLYPSP